MPEQAFVYIMANKARTLYTGVTSDLERRVYQHKNHVVPGFTKKYDVTRLVYFEQTDSIRAAIQREKELKGWKRARKIALIESMNAEWRDLAEDLFGASNSQDKRSGGLDSSLRSE